jgi:hypothetical protein
MSLIGQSISTIPLDTTRIIFALEAKIIRAVVLAMFGIKQLWDPA